MKKKKEKKHSQSLQDVVLSKLGFTVFLKAMLIWLDTGSSNLNKVVGSKKRGISVGKLYEIRGKKHAGKTALVMMLAAMAQKLCNAFVIWIDAENSLTNESSNDREFKNSWAKKFNLDTSPSMFLRVAPKVVISKKQRKKGKKITKAGDPILESAELLFEEAEIAMQEIKKRDKERPIFVAVDSVANLQTELAIGVGLAQQNMRTNLDRAIFLSNALPRWLSLISNYSAWMFLINQIRNNPNQLFGNPEYSPGGKGIEHNAHVQLDMKPFKTGVVMDDDENVIGIRGKLVNVKNKAGGGSKMGYKCGYRVDFSKKGRKMWRFFPLEQLGKE